MGLPLFVAPVESDLPSKAAAKGSNSSPARSGIRRVNRSDSRDRRNAARTASVRIWGAVPPRSGRPSQDPLMPWSESPGPIDQNIPESRLRPTLQVSREAREAQWQAPLNDSRHRDQFEEQMASLFGSDWRERGTVAAPAAMASQTGAEARDPDERPRAIDSRGHRARRAQRRAQLLAQTVPPLPARLGRSPDPTQHARETTSTTSRAFRIYESTSGDSTTDANRDPTLRHESRLLRSIREGRSSAIRNARGLDGLGDRVRSLSPEVWDTLLSTLTPDPQPPSAASSFASTAASQSAGQSSSTATSAPDATDTTGDAQCDSGCEHSDVNMEDDEENVDLTNNRPRQSALPPLRHPPPPSTLEPPVDDNSEHRRIGARRGFDMRRVLAQSQMDGLVTPGELTRPEGSGEETGDGSRGMPLARLLNRSEGWGSQGSGEEASEEESGGDGSRANEGAQSGLGQSSEEEWSGMQHIVRSLARREDIPDEWWAEVGLIRTLPQDAGAQ